MIVDRAPSIGLRQALATTFSGKDPCKWCELVREGHREEAGQEGERSTKLDLLACGIASVLVSEFPKTIPEPSLGGTPTVIATAPPVPPPRAFAASRL